MRNLEKNKRTIYFLNFVREEEVVDSSGFKTGEKRVVYAPRKPLKTNISGAKGEAQVEAFGADIKYDKIFVLTAEELARLKITENTVFFVDVKPRYDGTNPLYDYRCVKIADTLNSVMVAIAKVRR